MRLTLIGNPLEKLDTEGKKETAEATGSLLLEPANIRARARTHAHTHTMTEALL